MIDDFKPAPERQPSRLDSDYNFRPRPAVELPAPVDPVAPRFARPLIQPLSRPTPAFHTPQQVATDEQPGEASPTTPDTATTGTSAPMAVDSNGEELLLPAHASADKVDAAGKPATITLFRRWTVPKKKFFIILAAVLVLLAGSGAAYALTQKPEPAKKPAPVAVAKVVTPTPPPPILSPLTGMTVTKEQQELPVIGVMVENSLNARPQSGLKDAGVVYEAIAEAGITRFLALYQEGHPGNVGPIRSARPYYLDWAMAFDAAYAHVGGSPDALQRIKDIGVRDMDQFFNPSAYHRITSRFAPHNVYTSIDQLTDLARNKGYNSSSFTSFVRKAEKPYVAPPPTPSPTPAPATSSKTKAKTATPTPAPKPSETRAPANTIDLAISSSSYNAHYDYDAGSNSYKRGMASAPHMDADSNTQLAPKVVIALAMQYGLMADGFHSAYTTTQASGKMFVFQDGTVVTGTWSKAEPKDQFVFKDDAGKVLELNPGQTWISIVSDPAKVTYR